jgi:hypothetical protein
MHTKKVDKLSVLNAVGFADIILHSESESVIYEAVVAYQRKGNRNL